jgi:hypothetical protein
MNWDQSAANLYLIIDQNAPVISLDNTSFRARYLRIAERL